MDSTIAAILGLTTAVVSRHDAGPMLDSTIAILGILAVVVALCGFVFLPEWLRRRRMDKELQKRCRPSTPPDIK